jgi:hypothetical protein
MTINERSSKAEIISAACELTDSQAERISQLEQQQLLLCVMLASLAALLIF